MNMIDGNFGVLDCKMLPLPQVKSRSGSITSIFNNIDIPFAVQRVYYLYDIPGGESRGAHAHKKLEQLVIATSGSFDIILDDGINKRVINLNLPNVGLHIRPGMWRDITNFSSGAICLVLASEKYDEDDYYRSYDEFIKQKLSV